MSALLSSSILCSMFWPPKPDPYAERFGWYCFCSPMSETEGGASVPVGSVIVGILLSSSSVLVVPILSCGETIEASSSECMFICRNDCNRTRFSPLSKSSSTCCTACLPKRLCTRSCVQIVHGAPGAERCAQTSSRLRKKRLQRGLGQRCCPATLLLPTCG